MIALHGAINHEMCIGEEVSLSPIIRQTFSILPQKLGLLPFDTFERVFLFTLCVSFWY